jgi:hypothetical protein
VTPRQKEKAAIKGAAANGVTQTLVLQILTSLTTISSITGIDLNTLTATLIPTLNVPTPLGLQTAGFPGAPALGNPLMALLAQLQKAEAGDESEDESVGGVTEWHNLSEEDILERGSYPGESAKDRKERRRRNRMIL